MDTKGQGRKAIFQVPDLATCELAACLAFAAGAAADLHARPRRPVMGVVPYLGLVTLVWPGLA